MPSAGRKTECTQCTKDTSHVECLESEQKELQDKVARLEKQLREKDEQLREKDKESLKTEKYVEYIGNQLVKQNQCEETLRLNLRSQTEEADRKLAESIVVVQQLRRELKSRSEQVQQLGVELTEKNEIVAKLRASLKEVLDGDFRPVAHNAWRKEDQRTADAQSNRHGVTDIYSDLSDIGGTDTGSEASAGKARNLAEELEDADNEDGNDSSYDLDDSPHASEAEETQRASVPVDPDDPENSKASIECDESDVLSRSDSISAPNNTRKTYDQDEMHTSLQKSEVGNTDEEPEVLVSGVLKPAEKWSVVYGAQNGADDRNGNEYTLHTSDGEAKQCAPHSIEQGSRGNDRISIQEHISDAHTKTKTNTLELAKSDTTKRDGDSTPALIDTGEVHGRVMAETRSGNHGEVDLDGDRPEVDSIDTGFEVSAHEITTETDINLAEERTSISDTEDNANHGDDTENSRDENVHEPEVVASSYTSGPEEAQHNSTSSEQDHRGNNVAPIQAYRSYAHTTTDTRTSEPAGADTLHGNYDSKLSSNDTGGIPDRIIMATRSDNPSEIALSADPNEMDVDDEQPDDPGEMDVDREQPEVDSTYKPYGEASLHASEKKKAQLVLPLDGKDRPRKRNASAQWVGNWANKKNKIQTLELINLDALSGDYMSVSNNTEQNYHQTMAGSNTTYAESGVSALPTTADNLAGLSRSEENADKEMLGHVSAPESEETQRALILTGQGESHMSLDGPGVDSANAEPEVSMSQLPDLGHEVVGVGGSRDDADDRNSKDSSRELGTFRIASVPENAQRALRAVRGKGKVWTQGARRLPYEINGTKLANPLLAKPRPRTGVQPLKGQARPEAEYRHGRQTEKTYSLGNDVPMGGTGSVTDAGIACNDTVNNETSEPVASDVQGRDCNPRPASSETNNSHNPNRVDTLPEGHKEVVDLKQLEVERINAETAEMADVRGGVRHEDHSIVNGDTEDFRCASDREEMQRTPASIDQSAGGNSKALIRLDGSYDYTGTETETTEPIYELELPDICPDEETDYNAYDEQTLLLREKEDEPLTLKDTIELRWGKKRAEVGSGNIDWRAVRAEFDPIISHAQQVYIAGRGAVIIAEERIDNDCYYLVQDKNSVRLTADMPELSQYEILAGPYPDGERLAPPSHMVRLMELAGEGVDQFKKKTQKVRRAINECPTLDIDILLFQISNHSTELRCEAGKSDKLLDKLGLPSLDNLWRYLNSTTPPGSPVQHDVQSSRSSSTGAHNRESFVVAADFSCNNQTELNDYTRCIVFHAPEKKYRMWTWGHAQSMCSSLAPCGPDKQLHKPDESLLDKIRDYSGTKGSGFKAIAHTVVTALTSRYTDTFFVHTVLVEINDDKFWQELMGAERENNRPLRCSKSRFIRAGGKESAFIDALQLDTEDGRAYYEVWKGRKNTKPNKNADKRQRQRHQQQACTSAQIDKLVSEVQNLKNDFASRRERGAGVSMSPGSFKSFLKWVVRPTK